MKQSGTCTPMEFFRIFLILLITFPALTHAQDQVFSKDFKVRTGTPYKVIDAGKKYYFTNNNILLAIKITAKKVYVQRFDLKSMQQLAFYEITDLPNEYDLHNLIQIKGSVLFLYSTYTRSTELKQIFCRQIDFNNESFSAASKLIMELKGKVVGTTMMTSRFVDDVISRFRIVASSDSTKFLLQYHRTADKKNDPNSVDKISLSMFEFETEVKKLWSKDIVMPYNVNRIEELDFDIDAKGDAYVLAKVFDADISKDKDGAKLISVEVIKYGALLENPLIFKVDLPDKNIISIEMKECSVNSFAIAGFYNNNSKSNGVEGIFAGRISDPDKDVKITSYEIPLEIINQYSSSKEIKNNNKKAEEGNGKAVEFNRLKLKEIKSCLDGSLLLVGEQHASSTTISRSSNGSTTYSTKYFYDDLLAVKIGEDKNLIWMKRLPKSQVALNPDNGNSYKLIERGQDYYFLYIDNQKNLNLAITEEPEQHWDGRGGFLSAYKITGSNNMISKHIIFDTEDLNGIHVYQFSPSRLFMGDLNNFYLEVYKKDKEDILINISLNDSMN